MPLIAAACGAAVTKEQFTAVEDDVQSLQLEVKKLKGGSSTAAKATDAHGAAPAADAHTPGAPAHWTYAGTGGPSEWGAMAPENAVCGT
ncbi:MAG: hypothetical protein EXR66_03430 [Dehalococcoidia bacterium]|nr:hypothetical protein [Dehalococcoidia bacterium]